MKKNIKIYALSALATVLGATAVITPAVNAVTNTAEQKWYAEQSVVTCDKTAGVLTIKLDGNDLASGETNNIIGTLGHILNINLDHTVYPTTGTSGYDYDACQFTNLTTVNINGDDLDWILGDYDAKIATLKAAISLLPGGSAALFGNVKNINFNTSTTPTDAQLTQIKEFIADFRTLVGANATVNLNLPVVIVEDDTKAEEEAELEAPHTAVAATSAITNGLAALIASVIVLGGITFVARKNN